MDTAAGAAHDVVQLPVLRPTRPKTGVWRRGLDETPSWAVMAATTAAAGESAPTTAHGVGDEDTEGAGDEGAVGAGELEGDQSTPDGL